MSERRSISFNDNESDLLEYFENNGKSKIVKLALQFYIDNKDNVINECTLNLLKILNLSKPVQNPVNQNISSNNISKLKK
jgi:hypothetical protein